MSSALDAQPWGMVHIAVALVLVLASSGVLVAVALAVGGRLASPPPSST